MNLSNHFLLAMPTQNNNTFTGSVVYITQHTLSSGTVGVIINKPLGRTLKNAFNDVDFSQYNPDWSNNNLYFGGPIKSDNGFVLHRTIADDNKIFELTNNRNILTEIASSSYSDDLFIAVGYAAWAPLQLEHEICNNDWLVVQADANVIFNVEPYSRYNEAMRLLGIKHLGQISFGDHSHS